VSLVGFLIPFFAEKYFQDFIFHPLEKAAASHCQRMANHALSRRSNQQSSKRNGESLANAAPPRKVLPSSPPQGQRRRANAKTKKAYGHAPIATGFLNQGRSRMGSCLTHSQHPLLLGFFDYLLEPRLILTESSNHRIDVDNLIVRTKPNLPGNYSNGHVSAATKSPWTLQSHIR
jgi:hypothetical protein